MRGRITSLLFPTVVNAKRTLVSSTHARSPTPRRPLRKWSQAADDIVMSLVPSLVNIQGRPRWAKIAESLPGRSRNAVRARYMYSLNPDVKRGPWTKAEDEFITKEVQKAIDANRRPNWTNISSDLDGRTCEAVRKRWMRKLNPDIKRGPWTKVEESLLVNLAQSKVDEKGYPQWSAIATAFDGRTGDDVMNHYVRKLDPTIKQGPWTNTEDTLLVDLVQTKVDDKGRPQWAEIAKFVEGRTEVAVRERYRNTLDPKIKRGSWSKAEDAVLAKLVQTMVDEEGRQLWAQIGKVIGRSGKYVRDRKTNVINPGIRRGPWTKTEDERLIKLVNTKLDEK